MRQDLNLQHFDCESSLLSTRPVVPKVCSADHWWSARLAEVVREPKKFGNHCTRPNYFGCPPPWPHGYLSHEAAYFLIEADGLIFTAYCSLLWRQKQVSGHCHGCPKSQKFHWVDGNIRGLFYEVHVCQGCTTQISWWSKINNMWLHSSY